MGLSATHKTKNSTVSFGIFRTFVDNENIYKKLVSYFNCQNILIIILVELQQLPCLDMT